MNYALNDVLVKDVTAKGKRIASKEVKKVSFDSSDDQMVFC